MRAPASAIALLFAAGAAAQPAANHHASGRPTGVVLLIADGMGLPMMCTVAELTRAHRGDMAIESMPVVGLVRTNSASGVITDSAAAATALATGHKADNSAVGWFPDGSTHTTLVELAESAGWATGLLTTTDLTDATPAAWIARVPDRKIHTGIFDQMIASSVDVLAGGLRTASVQTARELATPGVPYPIAEDLRKRSVSAGRLMVNAPHLLPGATADTTRILLAYPERSPYDDAFGPPMAETLSAALAMLASDPQGFFIMAEVEETDNAGHANDTDRAVFAVIEVDDTVRTALEFQKANPGVLVLLTADHDTGAFSLDNLGNYKGPGGTPLWVSKNHTATRVPIYAAGPGAERFSGFLDNTEVFTILRDLMGLSPTGAEHARP